MVDCDADIVYKDENICILNPKLKKGIELVHVVGYLPVPGRNYFEMMDLIKKEGLKSTGELLKGKGIDPVKETEKQMAALDSLENIETDNYGISNRMLYYQYDKDTFNRIFFRPPSTVPYKYENGVFHPSGEDWRTAEHKQLFGGETYYTTSIRAAESTDEGSGIATIRVDPDKTYVFRSDVKDAPSYDNQSGINDGSLYPDVESKRKRWLNTRMTLTQYMEKLKIEYKDEAPIKITKTRMVGSKFKDETEELKREGLRIDRGCEVVATIPNLPVCVFDKLLSVDEVKTLNEVETSEDRALQVKAGNDRLVLIQKGRELELVPNKMFDDALGDKKKRFESVFKSITNMSDKITKKKPSPLESQTIVDKINEFNTLNSEIVKSVSDLAKDPRIPSMLPAQRKIFMKRASELQNELKMRKTRINQIKAGLGIIGGKRRKTMKQRKIRRRITMR